MEKDKQIPTQHTSDAEEPDIAEEYKNIYPEYYYGTIQLAKTNKSLDRYTNILPWDDHIPHLDGIDPNYFNGSEYIACVKFIKKNFLFYLASDEDRHIILTQAPLENTIEQFWSVVYQHNVTTIVKLVENDPERCYAYWSSNDQNICIGKYEIRALDIPTQEESDKETVRWKLFAIKEVDGTDERKITFLEYIHWPDHGIPDQCATLLTLIKATHATADGLNKTALIHSSAGIGRSEAFCSNTLSFGQILGCNERLIIIYLFLVLFIIYSNIGKNLSNLSKDDSFKTTLEKLIQELPSIPSIVRKLRLFRHPKVVQTPAQFSLIYTAIGQVAKSWDLYDYLPSWYSRKKNDELININLDGIKETFNEDSQIVKDLYYVLETKEDKIIEEKKELEVVEKNESEEKKEEEKIEDQKEDKKKDDEKKEEEEKKEKKKDHKDKKEDKDKKDKHHKEKEKMNHLKKIQIVGFNMIKIKRRQIITRRMIKRKIIKIKRKIKKKKKRKTILKR
ncbi:MAG: putative receptor-linked protein tyrosine phosphatase [Streblomastix strix]|uniref:Putative receptor-linked protein tyrosine phosphatase n=1 Tax=Streblomastix strix TaxID=222440 RepID=A0A5J4U635_9EUKA|nr:MAG: putative receptor-linked protein tyrosine phosphatase [Streblomastix strix]